MGWIQKIAEIVFKPQPPRPTDPGSPPPGPPIPDPVDRPPVIDPIGDLIGTAESAVNLASNIQSKITELEATLAQKVGGDKAKSVFLDVQRVIAPLDPQIAKQTLDSVEQFVNTLDFAYLNPLIALIAAEIQRARDNYWAQAQPIPDAVIAAMPAELSALAKDARHILVADANTLSIPSFAIKHFGTATAFTAIDLIFFEAIPGSIKTNDLFYWAHELTHVRQYKSMKLIEFAERYFHEEWKRIGDEDVYINELEREADTNACTHFPRGKPHYIKTCP